MITTELLKKAEQDFEIYEINGSFYWMAVGMLKKDCLIEALIFFLATWNFARFRYVSNNFNIEEFEKIIKNLKPHFECFKDEDFKTINYDNYKEPIKYIFDTLSKIKGVEFTGTSKLMHLLQPKVFVMWDGYIKGEKPIKYYEKLDIVKKGLWKRKTYKNNSDSYIEFLKDMQIIFKNVNYTNDRKTFTKAIDEFNYVNITLPIRKRENSTKKQKS